MPGAGRAAEPSPAGGERPSLQEVHAGTARSSFLGFFLNHSPLDLLCSNPPRILQLLGSSDTTIPRLRSFVFVVSLSVVRQTTPACAAALEDPSVPEPPAFLLELLEGKLAPHQHSLLLWGRLQFLPCLSSLFLCAFHDLLIKRERPLVSLEIFVRLL